MPLKLNTRQLAAPVRGNKEAGVRHAQRLEDVLLDIHVKGLSGKPSDQQCLDVNGEAVTPFLSRLEFQRQRADS